MPPIKNDTKPASRTGPIAISGHGMAICARGELTTDTAVSQSVSTERESVKCSVKTDRQNK